MHLSLNNCINYRFSLRNHKISSKIWDQLARVNCSKANKIARARKASEICLPWKIYECLPLCCWWISQGFPTRGCFELLNVLSRKIERSLPLSVSYSLIAIFPGSLTNRCISFIMPIQLFESIMKVMIVFDVFTRSSIKKLWSGCSLRFYGLHCASQSLDNVSKHFVRSRILLTMTG